MYDTMPPTSWPTPVVIGPVFRPQAFNDSERCGIDGIIVLAGVELSSPKPRHNSFSMLLNNIALIILHQRSCVPNCHDVTPAGEPSVFSRLPYYWNIAWWPLRTFDQRNMRAINLPFCRNQSGRSATTKLRRIPTIIHASIIASILHFNDIAVKSWRSRAITLYKYFLTLRLRAAIKADNQPCAVTMTAAQSEMLEENA